MRVYVPLTVRGLTDLHRTGSIGPAPISAHAVTPALRREWDGADEEELEYAALSMAAFDSLARIAETDDAPRRVVVAADVDEGGVLTGDEGSGDDVTSVTVRSPIPLSLCHAVHVDDASAEGEVAQAIARLPEATSGDSEALADVSLSETELLWFATQEIGDLLG